jgi:hypothetical protein
LQKDQKLFFFLIGQVAESSRDRASLSAMTLDGLLHAQGFQVVHESALGAQAPKGRSAKLSRRFGRTTLHDPVPGPYIV